MVKKIIVNFSLIILFNSCCYNGMVSEFGLPRKRINKLKPFMANNIIDTLALYKLSISYSINNISGEYVYFEKNADNSYPYISYMKFYPNGKLGLFVIRKTDTLNFERSFFDPRRAKMGYYWLEENILKTKISTIGDCSLYISNKKGVVIGDTIKLENHYKYGEIYIKKRVPKEFLENWKPDW